VKLALIFISYCLSGRELLKAPKLVHPPIFAGSVFYPPKIGESCPKDQPEERLCEELLHRLFLVLVADFTNQREISIDELNV
jgi:hypothetical protein